MGEILYKKIDAFTGNCSEGNPAGVVYLTTKTNLSEEKMQVIAKQQKGMVNEVVFCTTIEPGVFFLRYYSSECEVDFCGHATIACMYDLISNNPDLFRTNTITIDTPRGKLPVINDIEKSDSVFIMAPFPQYIPCKIAKKNIIDNLKLAQDWLDRLLPILLINAGLNTLIVPVKSLKTILMISPDQLMLEQFCIRNNVDIILVFCTEVYEKSNQYRTRVFAPKYGYLEDFATGSGNAAFGYYLLKMDIWDGNLILLEQGPSMKNPNIVKLSTQYSDGFLKVIFGGKATVRYVIGLDLDNSSITL